MPVTNTSTQCNSNEVILFIVGIPSTSETGTILIDQARPPPTHLISPHQNHPLYEPGRVMTLPGLFTVSLKA